MLPGHRVSTSRELGWDELKNGALLEAAESGGFQVMVTGDKNLSYQQNRTGRKLAIIVLATTNWNVLRLDPSRIVEALDRAKPGSFEEVKV